MQQVLVIDDVSNDTKVVRCGEGSTASILSFEVYVGCRKLKKGDVLPAVVRRRRTGGLKGGKGGFGAMLRSMGKAGGGVATTDFGACRDLEGRRLRHVNQDVALERWHEARKNKEALKKQVIDGWYLGVPSWAEVPKARKSKKSVRTEAKKRTWEDEERAVLESGVETRNFVGVVTMVDNLRKGFFIVDGDVYVPWFANSDPTDDWDNDPPRINDVLQVSCAAFKKGRNNWAAYKVARAHHSRRKVSAKQSMTAVTQPLENVEEDDAVEAGLLVRKKHRLLAKKITVAEETSQGGEIGVLAGEAKVDGLRAEGLSEFATVSLCSDSVAQGKWYYEVELWTAGVVQIGWASDAFTAADKQGDGVGDDAVSFAFDGCRQSKWTNGVAEAYGKGWAPGDVVGCFLDLDDRSIAFSLNGTHLGTAFQNIGPGPFFPAASIEDHEAISFPPRLRYLPTGFQPLTQTTTEAQLSSTLDLTPHESKHEVPTPLMTMPPQESKQELATQDETKQEVPPPPPPPPPPEDDDEQAKQEEQEAPPPKPKEKPPIVPVALDLTTIASLDDLTALGLDRLKSALVAIGCKCGGNLEARARRLWSTKGKDSSQWDPKILAKK